VFWAGWASPRWGTARPAKFLKFFAEASRHLNKEKQPIPEYLLRAGDTEKTRVRDVIYWYMDYREFANVVKYRIAMMRKSIQAKISAVSEVEPSRVACHLKQDLTSTLHITQPRAVCTVLRVDTSQSAALTHSRRKSVNAATSALSTARPTPH
jgi:hypothetical protein